MKSHKFKIKRPSFRDTAQRNYGFYLQDIADACAKVVRYTAGLTPDEFSTDELKVDAVMRNLEIIGEAVVHVPQRLKKRYPDVEWTTVRRLRNMVAHEYFGLDYELIWEVIQVRIPVLLKQMERIVEREGRKLKDEEKLIYP